MSITASVGKRDYEGGKNSHAEEEMFGSGRYNDVGDFTVEMNGWPCIHQGRHHDCHGLFIKQSAGRVITLVITDDRGGYSADHGFPQKGPGEDPYTGTITYDDGTPTIVLD